MKPSKLFSLALPDEKATINLGKNLAIMASKSDLFALIGDLGTGKTTLARSFIQHYFEKPDLEVPSPTFNLVLEYKEVMQRPPLFHYDLYRLSDPDELYELGFQESINEGIALVEWPENAGDMLPPNYLAIQLIYDEKSQGRIANFYGAPSWQTRWQRQKNIEDFLVKNLPKNYQRHPMMGDASLRNYERIESNNKTLILMNDKGREGGAVIANGKTYPEIAHITLTIEPFIGICNLLRSKGFCAPEIIDFDLDDGLILLEHLGNGKIINDDNSPINERYQLAVELLAQIHQENWSNITPVRSGISHNIPPFDPAAMLIEVELFLTWYLPRFNTANINQVDKDEFYQIWGRLIEKTQSFEQSLLLRDYHSPNIIWRDDQTGFDQIGLIDFQDAMIGPASYDVVSICNDARIDMPYELEQKLIASYVASRLKHDPTFNEKIFHESYAIMAAHRATKILGGFVRSDERDGKPAYLAYLPRMRDYLKRALQHPALGEFKTWLDKHNLLNDN
jgi:tRNA threonylcarbamoyl adenosine modification protein YjeE